MKKILIFAVLILFVTNLQISAQGLKTFTLRNGLTVYVWEDPSQSDVFGLVGVKAGSIYDPSEYTGLAHYLEHVLFKGTDKIGALDWEKEKPLYEQIIAKYDEKANTNDQAKKDAINKEINELTVEAGKISISNEFTNLIDGIGSTMLNAGTGYDQTSYYNIFPSHQINKWLELSSERFINPVFRAFQTELETVYEEFNMYNDNPMSAANAYMLSTTFAGTPYEQSVIGKGEHLKNPRLSELIKFYNKWYVPENMVLILVGNVNTEQISGKIASSFGRLEKRTVPERPAIEDKKIKGHKTYSVKITPQPYVILAYNGVKSNDKDEFILEMCSKLLSNNSRTGLLDKLSIDGDIMAGGSFSFSLVNAGRFILQALPNFDRNQNRYQSNKSVEKMMTQTIEKLVQGNFEEWIFEAIKMEMCRDFDLAMENNYSKGEFLFDLFIGDKDLEQILQYKEIVSAITIDDVKRVAKEYFSGNNYNTINFERGKPTKKDNIKKAGYKPLDPPAGKSSVYAQQFMNLPASTAENMLYFGDIKEKTINERSRFLYSQNKENDLFMLTLKYGVGEETFPKLPYAAYLMGNAGVMGMYEPQEFKSEMARLGATCNISANHSYLTITIRGYEENLQDVCQLLTRQILMPKLDTKQLDNVIGMELSSRFSAKSNVSTLTDALEEYLIYKDNSEFINRLTDRQVYNLQISELTGDIVRASNYESVIHYSGSASFDDVYTVLSTSLPFVASEKSSDSPVVRETTDYKENTIHFFGNNDTRQSQIFIYFLMDNYKKEDDAMISLFNNYFGSGGLGSLVIDEIREKNSMAYTTSGVIISPPVVGKKLYFSGSIGTQNDKTVDAIKLYMNLIKDMPQEKERFEKSKINLLQSTMSSRPGPRNKTAYYERYKKLGYEQDPSIEILEKLNSITFDDFIKYYNDNIKNRNIGVAIFGNPKDVKLDDLRPLGRIVRLDEKNLFSDKDKMF